MHLLLRRLRSRLRIRPRQPGEVLSKAVPGNIAVKRPLRTEIRIEGVPAAHVLARRRQPRLLPERLQQAVFTQREKECMVAIELLPQRSIQQTHLLVATGESCVCRAGMAALAAIAPRGTASAPPVSRLFCTKRRRVRLPIENVPFLPSPTYYARSKTQRPCPTQLPRCGL